MLGALAGVIGALQAMETIREIVGFGEGLVGKLLLVDALHMRFETMSLRLDPANPLNGTGRGLIRPRSGAVLLRLVAIGMRGLDGR